MPDKKRLLFLKISLSIAFLSFYVHFLLFTHIDLVLSNDFLGVLSSLPLSYWIGLTLVITILTLAYFLEDLNFAKIGLFFLVIVLFGTFIFIEPNARGDVSYYDPTIGKQIIQNGGHISNDFSVGSGNPYLYFTANPIFTAILLLIPGIGLDIIIRYSPLFLMLFAVLLSYIVFKTIFRDDIRCLILSSILFPAFFWSEQLYFGPQFFSVLLLLLAMILFIKMYRAQSSPIKTKLLMVIILTSLVFTHPLAPVMIITFLLVTFLVVSLKLKRKLPIYHFLFFCSSLYIIFLFFNAYQFFNGSLNILIKTLKNGILEDIVGPRLTTVGTFSQTIVSDIRLLLTIFILSSVFLYLFAKILKKKTLSIPDDLIIPFCWVLGGLALAPLVYDMEIIQRISLFIMVGSIPFLAKLLRSRKKIAIVFIAAIILVQPIAYTGGDFFRFTPNSELKGSQFAATALPQNSVIFYDMKKYVWYFNPYMGYQSYYTLRLPPRSDFDLTQGFQYLITSIVQHNAHYYYLGYDPISNQTSQIVAHFERVYDNGYFEISKRC